MPLGVNSFPTTGPVHTLFPGPRLTCPAPVGASPDTAIKTRFDLLAPAEALFLLQTLIQVCKHTLSHVTLQLKPAPPLDAHPSEHRIILPCLPVHS